MSPARLLRALGLLGALLLVSACATGTPRSDDTQPLYRAEGPAGPAGVESCGEAAWDALPAEPPPLDEAALRQPELPELPTP